jgi:hypothetical protein
VFSSFLGGKTNTFFTTTHHLLANPTLTDTAPSTCSKVRSASLEVGMTQGSLLSKGRKRVSEITCLWAPDCSALEAGFDPRSPSLAP